MPRHGRQRGDENRALERDGMNAGQLFERTAADVDRVRDRRRPVLQRIASNATHEAADEHDERQAAARLAEP